ncbi:MAG: efflux transporter periplasmic adaptor subunit, partial [Ignavibacterium sp.]
MTRRTRNIVYAVTGLIVLLLIVSPKLSIFSGQDAPSASSASTMDLRLPVSVRVVRPERVEEKIRSTGTVLANEEVALRSEIAGIIRQI